MKEKQKKRLGEILIEDGVLSRGNLEEALVHQKKQGGLIGQILISLGYLTEESLVAALGKQLGFPYLPLLNYSINMEAAKRFQEAFCRANMLMPFDEDEKYLYFAVADPLNESVIQEAEKISKRKAQIFISTPTEIMNMLDLVYSQASPDEPKVKKAG